MATPNIANLHIAPASAAPVEADDVLLEELGYKPVLNRVWGRLTSVAVTISAMSVLTSITASFGTGLYYGGPVVCIFGWIAVSFFILCEALGMAELASAYPTTGGMYYWMFKLAPDGWGPLLCWVTGWLNLLGQAASLASSNFLFANIIATIILLTTGTAAGDGYVVTSSQLLGLYAGCLVSTATLNSSGSRVLAVMTDVGAWFHLLACLTIIVGVPCVAMTHQDAKFVFTKFLGNFAKEDSLLPSSAYGTILALLLPAYSYTGLDGPVHMSEEVVQAATRVPMSILTGYAVMFFGGGAMIISLLFSIQSLETVLDIGENPAEAAGDAVAQILWDAFKGRFGHGAGGTGMLVLFLIGVFFCSYSTMSYVSRIMFAYARDKALPFSNLWEVIDNRYTHTPLLSVWGITFFAFCLGLPMLGNITAFNAILSLSTIALTIVYCVPTTMRITIGRKVFVPGPFNLGWWAYPCGVCTTMWMIFATIVFCLPTEYPVTVENVNYACLTLGGTVIISLIWFYFPGIGAYKWFKGPVKTIEPSKLVVIHSKGELMS